MTARDAEPRLATPRVQRDRNPFRRLSHPAKRALVHAAIDKVAPHFGVDADELKAQAEKNLAGAARCYCAIATSLGPLRPGECAPPGALERYGVFA